MNWSWNKECLGFTAGTKARCSASSSTFGGFPNSSEEVRGEAQLEQAVDALVNPGGSSTVTRGAGSLVDLLSVWETTIILVLRMGSVHGSL